LALLPLLAIAALMKLRRKGQPVLARELRYGLGTYTFAMFRLGIQEGADATRLDAFVQRWRIDELPQFWNVLVGSMSVVGPRPLREDEFTQLDEFQQARYVVKPGITGLWQIARRQSSLEDMTNLDLIYCRKWTPLLDLTIVLRMIVRSTAAWPRDAKRCAPSGNSPMAAERIRFARRRAMPPDPGTAAPCIGSPIARPAGASISEEVAPCL
jgi:lipopolysaccharide/colanic/teichoic acid biosynthesis glycosyltransferase